MLGLVRVFACSAGWKEQEDEDDNGHYWAGERHSNYTTTL
jgi:hypothetical protein